MQKFVKRNGDTPYFFSLPAKLLLWHRNIGDGELTFGGKITSNTNSFVVSAILRCFG